MSMDDFFQKPKRRPVKELNLVPVIDLFTTIVFFLLLSTSTIAFTKLTVPPSAVSTVTNPIAPPPMATKLLVLRAGNQRKLLLQWMGKEPGQFDGIVTADDPKALEKALLEKATDLTTRFTKKYPKETTVQLGLGPDVTYQNLINVMDGIREHLPDVVLISYQEAVARGNKSISTESTP